MFKLHFCSVRKETFSASLSPHNSSRETLPELSSTAPSSCSHSNRFLLTAALLHYRLLRGCCTSMNDVVHHCLNRLLGLSASLDRPQWNYMAVSLADRRSGFLFKQILMMVFYKKLFIWERKTAVNGDHINETTNNKEISDSKMDVRVIPSFSEFLNQVAFKQCRESINWALNTLKRAFWWTTQKICRLNFIAHVPKTEQCEPLLFSVKSQILAFRYLSGTFQMPAYRLKPPECP